MFEYYLIFFLSKHSELIAVQFFYSQLLNYFQNFFLGQVKHFQ